uniref:39S ribosomal protein L33, mitochondrial n=9 Tax=Neognathae TaxID=8825 RepID=A0A8C9L8T2_PAVCR
GFLVAGLIYILVRMKSAAETGYCFNVRRLRLQEKLVLLRYDPIGKRLGQQSACFVLTALTVWGERFDCSRIFPI